MVYKKKIIPFFFLIIFSYNNAFSDIIYDKNEVILTHHDVNQYIKILNKNLSLDIRYNQALKNLILTEKTISELQNNNKLFMDAVDEKLITEISNYEKLNNITKNFYRFNIIRNEFIYEYYDNNLSIQDIEKALIALKDEEIQLSQNSCLTVSELIKLSNIKEYEKIIFQNLNNLDNISILIDEKIYQICFQKNFLNTLDFNIFTLVQSLTENDFKEFIYKKL